ncbi:hypothetical protein HY491_02700 [Candidatus Woesearchaeota archaeon]|nr:hypothetical protein [Candidatus Woesearchaeota archaeon]
MRIRQIFREKILSISSSVSGIMGFLGGYQVCHTICLGIIALLSVIGITLVGMPLLFLTKVAIPFWIAASFLFLVSLYFYFKSRCISKSLILFNGGIIIAGIPFGALREFSSLFLVIGGSIVLISIVLFIKDKTTKNKSY